MNARQHFKTSDDISGGFSITAYVRDLLCAQAHLVETASNQSFWVWPGMARVAALRPKPVRISDHRRAVPVVLSLPTCDWWHFHAAAVPGSRGRGGGTCANKPDVVLFYDLQTPRVNSNPCPYFMHIRRQCCCNCCFDIDLAVSWAWSGALKKRTSKAKEKPEKVAARSEATFKARTL